MSYGNVGEGVTAGEHNSHAVQQRFMGLNLSDCALLGLRTQRDERSYFENTVLDLGLITHAHADRWEHGRLTFIECASLELNIDFWEKRHLADTISEAGCEPGEKLAGSTSVGLAHSATAESLRQFVLFWIRLSPSAGNVRVLARDFVLDRT